MDDLVRVSGLSKGSLYWYFRSKQQVFLALFESFEAEIFARWDRADSAGGDFLERIGSELAVVIDRICSEPQLLRAWAEFLTHAEARDRLALVYRRSRERLARWLRRGIESGQLLSLSVDGMAAALVAQVEGLLVQAMVDPAFDARRHWATAWQVAKEGVSA